MLVYVNGARRCEELTMLMLPEVVVCACWMNPSTVQRGKARRQSVGKRDVGGWREAARSKRGSRIEGSSPKSGGKSRRTARSQDSGNTAGNTEDIRHRQRESTERADPGVLIADCPQPCRRLTAMREERAGACLGALLAELPAALAADDMWDCACAVTFIELKCCCSLFALDAVSSHLFNFFSYNSGVPQGFVLDSLFFIMCAIQ
ncbi:uncharacterized protein LOC133660160 [Entelurus aequoreus]|uniref:uncharacterized protein LOC133660160 n=1 Tax=Entelurus aequoreus TaxID=161455 RepID=UPI002B1D0E89|nr:uncharacterized protein LOC133660160 [Entelurus aequoreus]